MTHSSTLDYLSHRPIVIDGEGGAADTGRGGGFAEHRLGGGDMLELPRIGRIAPVFAELSSVIDSLTRHAAGNFGSVSQLYTSLQRGTVFSPSVEAKRVLRDLFLLFVDRRLQQVYREHFAAHPPPVGTPHDRKITSLEAVRTQARNIVGSYDWRWLAQWLELEEIGENAATCVRRLSNFAFEIQRVNFRFTYHCNISCRHCYNGSGPHLKEERIPLETMRAIVAQMPSAGIGRLNLTGGEPFLYPDVLVALIAAGRSVGLRGISIYTNGFWASTDERAKRMLRRLSAAGFMQESGDHLKVSAGIYHQEFIKLDCVLTLTRNYRDLFGQPLRVDFELLDGEPKLSEQIKQKFTEAGLAESVRLSFRSVTPLGRGKQLEDIKSYPIDDACSYIDQIVFDPDGSSRPCCGLNNENQGVTIGTLTTGLLALVKHMQNDPVLQYLAAHPMRSIFKHLDKSENPNGYSGVCHLCQDALGDLSNKEPLQAELFERQKFYPFWFELSGTDHVRHPVPDSMPNALD